MENLIVNSNNEQEVIKEYYSPLHNLAYKIIGNEEHASDIVQDSFESWHKSIDKFRGESSLFTYLYRIVTNKSINFIRKQKREKKLIQKIENNFNNDEHNPIKSTELKMVFDEAFKKVPDKYLKPLLLVEYEQFDYKKISKILDIPLNTVRSRISRAREKLLKILKEMGVTNAKM